jgi:hypothetical protein
MSSAAAEVVAEVAVAVDEGAEEAEEEEVAVEWVVADEEVAEWVVALVAPVEVVAPAEAVVPVEVVAPAEAVVPVVQDTVDITEVVTEGILPYREVLMEAVGAAGDGGGPITQIVNVDTMAVIAITAM